jgi:DUF3047 family protein
MVNGRAHEAVVLARALLRARRRRRLGEPRPGLADLEELRDRLEDARIVSLPAGRSRWADTGIDLAPGDEVTTFAVGGTVLSRAFDVRVRPPLQLWFRAGGPVFRGTRETHSFTAAHAGRLHLANYAPTPWAAPDGSRKVSERQWSRVSGGMHVLVALDAELDALREASPLVAAELDRRAGAPAAPDGWSYLWEIGDSEIFAADGGRIACDCHGDTAILQREVDVELTEATRLRWSWRVDELPSELAEDTPATHDYLSIAVEFDNGQDLTWHWSAELPPGHHYRCPFPPWRERETHMVVRSGANGLGRWLTEERAVRADYTAAVGAPPARIVKVWLIAVSHVQRGRGRCAFADIELRDGDRVERLG